MARNTRPMPGVSPREVFEVLSDGKSYGDWVVGTRKIRAVDDHWPEPGSCLHYTVGYRPLRKDDRTVAVTYTPDRSLVLEVRAWPAGAATVALMVRVAADGLGSEVTIEEEPSRGFAKLVHNPLLDLLIKVRNVETLRRLERLARARRARGRGTDLTGERA